MKEKEVDVITMDDRGIYLHHSICTLRWMLQPCHTPFHYVCLVDIKKLALLNMDGYPVTASCLKLLAGLTNLESLNLDSYRINDDGMVHLAGQHSIDCLW